MSAFATVSELPGGCGVVQLPTVRGRQYSAEGGCLSTATFPADSIGTFALTLTNVVVGSRVRVERAVDGEALYDGVAASGTVEAALPAYPAGNAYSAIRVKVRKGSSAPYHKPYETLATAVIGAQSIYVSQIPD